tara:strand:+ start:1015 stop:1293 length:279 start_codon:yes stop_codon:yes gene_type:complete
MKRLDLSKIKTKRDFKNAMAQLEAAWMDVSKIKDRRKRAKQIIKLRKDVQILLQEYKRCNNKKKETPCSFFRQVFCAINDWLKETVRRERQL